MWNLGVSQTGIQFIYAASEWKHFRECTLKREIGKNDKEFLFFINTRPSENSP